MLNKGGVYIKYGDDDDGCCLHFFVLVFGMKLSYVVASTMSHAVAVCAIFFQGEVSSHQ